MVLCIIVSRYTQINVNLHHHKVIGENEQGFPVVRENKIKNHKYVNKQNVGCAYGKACINIISTAWRERFGLFCHPRENLNEFQNIFQIKFIPPSRDPRAEPTVQVDNNKNWVDLK